VATIAMQEGSGNHNDAGAQWQLETDPRPTSSHVIAKAVNQARAAALNTELKRGQKGGEASSL